MSLEEDIECDICHKPIEDKEYDLCENDKTGEPEIPTPIMWYASGCKNAINLLYLQSAYMLGC